MKKDVGFRQVIKSNICSVKFISLVIVNRLPLLSSFSSFLEDLITCMQIMSPSEFLDNLEILNCHLVWNC
jgi:hypothetical protein